MHPPDFSHNYTIDHPKQPRIPLLLKDVLDFKHQPARRDHPKRPTKESHNNQENDFTSIASFTQVQF